MLVVVLALLALLPTAAGHPVLLAPVVRLCFPPDRAAIFRWLQWNHLQNERRTTREICFDIRWVSDSIHYSIAAVAVIFSRLCSPTAAVSRVLLSKEKKESRQWNTLSHDHCFSFWSLMIDWKVSCSLLAAFPVCFGCCSCCCSIWKRILADYYCLTAHNLYGARTMAAAELPNLVRHLLPLITLMDMQMLRLAKSSQDSGTETRAETVPATSRDSKSWYELSSADSRHSGTHCA